MNESELRGKGRCHVGLWIVIGHGRVAEPFPCFSLPFQNCGCPVPAHFPRAGGVLLHHAVSGSGNIRQTLQASVVPALRREREGRGTRHKHSSTLARQ